MPTKRTLASVIVSTALVCISPSVAHADDEDPSLPPGQDYVGMAPPISDLAYSLTPYALANKLNVDAQLQLMDLYDLKEKALNLGEVTTVLDTLIETVQSAVEDLTGLPIAEVAPEPGTVESGDANTPEEPSPSADPDVTMAPASFVMTTSPTTEAKLGISQVGQQRNWWCGPATGYVILKYKNKTSKNGVALSQAALAGSGYMRTDQHHSAGNGATNWGDGDMARGLNNWGSLGYVQTAHPTATQLKTIFKSKIGAKRPIALGTYEAANDQHYNYHPNDRRVYHWITGYGYYNSGANVRYADSATTVWPNVQPTRTMQTVNMANFIHPYGTVA